MTIKLNVNIEDKHWKQLLPRIEELSQEVLQTTLNFINPSFLQNKKEISLNLQLSDDKEIQSLNKYFRHLDKATNILSFANIDDEDFVNSLDKMETIELGDIIIAFETMEQQSKEQEISFHDHYIHILIHGILHLLGYDHIEEDERQEMEDMEIRILTLFDISNPYSEQD